MSSPIYSAADYAQALHALFPRGRVWPRDSDSIQAKLIAGLASIYYRTGSRAVQLLQDSFPADTYELLPEWEKTLGLPSACTGVLPTAQQRRGAVVARFIGNGGQSAAYFINYAANLGYPISITNHAPFRAGQSCSGQPLGTADWFFYWEVNCPANELTNFRAGQSSSGEPLSTWGNTRLICELTQLKPAHSILNFNYV